MKTINRLVILISLFIALTPSLKAMQETKEVNKIDEKASDLSFKAIKERLAALDFQGWHFSLQKTRSKKLEDNKIRKTIDIWFINPSNKQEVPIHIGYIIYLVPKEPKHDGTTLDIVIDMIQILKKECTRIKLGTLITLAALQDALKPSIFHPYAYAEALNPASKGLFKDKLKFEKSEKFPKWEKLSTEKLPEIMKTHGPTLLEEAFKKLEAISRKK